MREIKFRGYQAELKKWFYGSLIQLPNGGCFIFDYKDNFEDRVVVVPESVGQYTGLKDINGKEIYEGDIIETSDGNCFVRYDEATTSYEVVFEDEAVISLWEAAVYGTKKVEVIGNIYENQDLLKS